MALLSPAPFPVQIVGTQNPFQVRVATSKVCDACPWVSWLRASCLAPPHQFVNFFIIFLFWEEATLHRRTYSWLYVQGTEQSWLCARQRLHLCVISATLMNIFKCFFFHETRWG